MPVRAIAAILLLATAGWPPAGPAPDLSEAYPNPIFEDDEVEFVVLDVPRDTRRSAYELSDGEDTIRLPPRPGVVYSPSPRMLPLPNSPATG